MTALPGPAPSGPALSSPAGSSPAGSSQRRLLAFAPFLLVSAIYLTGKLLADAQAAAAIETVLKPLLMAMLLISFMTIAQRWRTRMVALTVLGLVFSWVGDVTLSTFLVGLSAFLIAHLFYIALFLLEFGGRIRWWTAVYLLPIAGLTVLLAPHLGSLLVPVIGYGLILAFMAACATRGNWRTGLGGALFLLSDSVLAVNMFHPEQLIPNAGFIVMVSYLGAQGLIAWGVLHRLSRDAAAN